MKNTINLHIEAIKDTFSLLSKGNFLLYFIPGVIATLFFALFHYLIGLLFGSTNEISEQAGWFATAFSKVGSVFDFISTQFYIFLVLTVFSPVNTILSEKLDSKLTGQKFSFSIIRLINDFIRMIFIVIIALSLEFIFIIIWWLFCWIFGLDNTFVYQIISFLIGAFFFGFSFYDHSLERYQISVFGSIGFAFSNMLMVMTTGAIFKLLYYFPYIWEVSYLGIMLAPVLTTMISTIVYIRYRKIYPVQTN